MKPTPREGTVLVIANPKPPTFHRVLILPLIGVLATASAARAEGPDPRLAGYRTPPGWKVSIAATEPLVINPVTMTFGLDGRLYVVEWQAGRGPNDHIKVLTDTDGDGAFDKADMYMDGLDLPAGVLFWDGWTYVTLDHDVVRFKDKDGDGKFETREVIASGFGNDDSHHRVSGMTMGPDGWIYLTTGDSDAHAKGSDGSTATVLRSGGVFRCKPDGSHMENVAFGMRNPWGNIAFDDEFRIFHTDNDNEGAAGFTGCRILHVVEGGDYGWRLREGARCCQPDYERATWNGGRPGRLGWVAETGRGAPAGLCVLNSAAFPPSTRNLLVYPDVFRKLVRAYKLKPAGATFTVAEEFELLASDDPLFRPDDAEIGPDGALYILDWRTDSGGAGQLSGNGKTGRIYRVTWGGTEKEPARAPLARDRFAKLLGAEDARLVQALTDDDYNLRRTANLELIRRGGKDTKALIEVVKRMKPESARLHALVTLSATNTLKTDKAGAGVPWDFGILGGSPALRRLAFECLGRFADFRDYDLTISMIGAKEEDYEALRAFALAIGRFGSAVPAKPRTGSAQSVAQALAEFPLLSYAENSLGEDPFFRDGWTRGLERLGPDALKVLLRAIADGKPKSSAAALYALQGWRDSSGVEAVLTEATTREPIPPSARVGLFRALREFVPSVPADRIVEWLVGGTNAPPEARVEAIRVLIALHQRAALAAGPILPSLLADSRDEVRRESLRLAAEVRSADAKASLVSLVQAENRRADERRLALVALRSYQDNGLAPLLSGLLAKSTDAGFRIELLRTLAALDFKAAAEGAKALLSSKDRELRQEAIGILGQRPETALIVAQEYNDGKLSPEDLARVIEAVRPHATPELQAAMQSLLKKTLLAAPTGAEASRLREYVGRFGSPDRGKALYLDTKKVGCTVCHRLEGSGGAVGPDLTRIYETLSFDKRVEAILEPSKEIKEGFGTFKVATTDGRIVTGLLLGDTPEGVALKDAQGCEVRISAKEIEDKGPDKASLMPVGVVGNLSFNEFADLLSFLGDRKAQESLRALAKPN
ncbi:MAG: PQQ-dependent sugar dehydrogenase [Isosphaeraceae bacterium]|nr:PQQ-dependent sugar dehydrogenase [Isosphaeraceae bacterium]